MHVVALLLLVSLLAEPEALAAPPPPTAPAVPAAAYEAKVTATTAYALSGPGLGYYPTKLLHPGDTVVAVGERQGAWVAIKPPRGSFSYVALEAIAEQPDGSGLVKANDTRVRLGSDLHEAHHVFQVVLNKGDKVRILDQVQLREENRVVSWYKVLPPPEEMRYVAAEALQLPGTLAAVPPPLPWLEAGPTPQARLPQTTPERLLAQPVAGVRSLPAAVPMRRPEKTLAISAEKPTPEALAVKLVDRPELPFEERLQLLRLQLEVMRTREPTHWDIETAQTIMTQLEPKAANDDQKQALREMNAHLRRLAELKYRYERHCERRDAALRHDRELEEAMRQKQLQLQALRPQFTAEGILARSSLEGEGRATYLLEREGQTIYLLNPIAGLRLESYVGRRVGLLGEVSGAANAIPLLQVRQVTPLDNVAPFTASTP